MQFRNTRDIDAVWHYMVGTVSTNDDSPDLDEMFALLKRDLQPQARNIRIISKAVSISRGMGIGLQLREIARSDIDAAKEGVHPMYVFVLAAYVGPETPKDHLWVTELCARIKKPFDGNLEACQTHNGYYYSDSNLTGVP